MTTPESEETRPTDAEIEAAAKWLRERIDKWRKDNYARHAPNRTNAVIVHAPHVVTVLAALEAAAALRQPREGADE